MLILREELREKIYEVTNWEAMTEWCTAPSTDIEQLREIADKLLTKWKKERTNEKKRNEQLVEKMEVMKKKGATVQKDDNSVLF